ncbi:MAG: 23S rRNA (uracil(1939)-C(5))-methyltransferase RlmD [Vicinamibacterales bacterium]|nr:23S rRNA (uracil(1939)-C(5))-methyltransferase RlmD [Vicinamibacterales bacterium]
MQCKHFGVCGGCSLPGVPYAEQLLRKQARLAQLLGVPVPPLVPSPREDRFRSKSAFVFGPAGQGRGLVMGHYARGSKQIVRVDECPVHSDRGNRIAFALRDRLMRARIYGVGAQRNGLVRHILVRTTADDRQAVAMLVVTRNDKALRTPIRGLLASADRPDGFFINIHDKPSPYMVGPETIRIDGHSHIKETIGATSYLVSPTAFFQTNVGSAREVLNLVIEGVMDKPKGLSPPVAEGLSPPVVLDLYSGSGLFALPIAQAGARVTAVEENRQAVKDAEANIRLNRIAGGQVRLVCSRVEDALARLPPQRGCRAGGPVAGDRWDAVVLDPPRQGCPPAVLAGVFETIAPPRVVYVSCNPEALAQELPVILKAGYLVSHLQAVDMFPHTDHIETVAVFTRR